jgi:hypothetical protein
VPGNGVEPKFGIGLTYRKPHIPRGEASDLNHGEDSSKTTIIKLFPNQLETGYRDLAHSMAGNTVFGLESRGGLPNRSMREEGRCTRTNDRIDGIEGYIRRRKNALTKLQRKNRKNCDGGPYIEAH